MIVNVTREAVLAGGAVLGGSFWLRLRGLMFRRRFEPFDGLWLAPTNAIHMFWVRFPIDLVWLDDERRVVRVHRAVRPWRLAWARGASSVLELPVGTIDRTGTEPGDLIRFDPPPGA